MAAAEMVEVIAVSDGFYNGTEQRKGTTFKVLAGRESGSSWFRPVAVSIPQTAAPVVEEKPKRAKKRDESESDLG